MTEPASVVDVDIDGAGGRPVPRSSSGAGRRLSVGLERFGLGDCAVLDVGCGGGTYLRAFGPGSVGLELQTAVVEGARRAGLDVRHCNIESDEFPVGDGLFDAVWLSNYLEHSLAPHALLIRLRRHLRENGLLLVAIPIVPPTVFRRFLLERFSPWRGIYAADHVNFFTAQTARKTIERAGFDVEDVVAPSIAWPRIARAMTFVWPTAMFVARKRSGWTYPAKAHKQLVSGRIVPKP